MRALKGGLILWAQAGIQPVRGFDLTRYLGTWHEVARQPSLTPPTLESLVGTAWGAGSDTRALTCPQAAVGPSAGSGDECPVGKPIPVLSTLGADHHDQRHP